MNEHYKDNIKLKHICKKIKLDEQGRVFVKKK